MNSRPNSCQKQLAHYRSILLLEVSVLSERMVTALGLGMKHHELLFPEAGGGLTPDGHEVCCSLRVFLGRGAEQPVLWGLESSPLCEKQSDRAGGLRSCPWNGCQALWVSWLVASSCLERAAGSAGSCQVSPGRFLMGRELVSNTNGTVTS